MDEYSRKRCDEVSCKQLRKCNIAYRFYNPLGGPEEEGWSMLSDVYEFEEPVEGTDEIDVVTQCGFVKISNCPFCAKKLSAVPDTKQIRDGLYKRK